MITGLVPEHPMIIVIPEARIVTITTVIIITIIIVIIIRAVQVVQAADQEQAIQAEVITETTAEDLTEIILGKTMINKSCEIRERIK